METLSGTPCDTAEAVLARTRELRAALRAADAETLQRACDWADLHLLPGFDSHVHGPLPEEILPDGWSLDLEKDYKFEGPWLSRLAWDSPAEFAAALGRSTGYGTGVIQRALELRGRLPRIWARVLSGEVEGYRAQWVAETTLNQPDTVAVVIDRLVAPIAHKIGKVTLDRVLKETLLKLDPLKALRDSQADLDRRGVDLFDQVTAGGVAEIRVRADLKDALDFDAAVAEVAAALAADGCEESLDIRRSLAVGVLADPHAAADLLTRHATGAAPDDTASTSRLPARRPRKQAVLHLHLSEAAVTGTPPAGATPAETPSSPLLGRLEQGNQPILTDRIRDWCGRTDTHLTVLPIRDLADHHATDAYEHPDRLDEQVELIHKTCMFPWCTRPARRCDKDHSVPYDDGGRTCSCNTVPLCRRHHRLKTHTSWSYQTIETGVYLWTSPHGQTYLRDLTGTHDLTPPAFTHHPADGCRQRAP